MINGHIFLKIEAAWSYFWNTFVRNIYTEEQNLDKLWIVRSD